MLSTVLGFGFGWLCSKVITLICRGMDRRRTTGFFGGAQIAGGATMAFMHGAQDGQKFMGVFMLGVFLVNGQGETTTFQIPIWLMLLCSLVMGAGHLDRRIPHYQIGGNGHGEAGKISGLFGGYRRDRMSAPVFAYRASGFHNSHKDNGDYGSGRRAQALQRQLGNCKGYGLTWLLTFPGCGLIGFLMAKLFMWIF